MASAMIEDAKAELTKALVTPVRAMRARYVPLLMVYFSYGALGLIGVARDFWIKESLTLSAADLAAIGVWVMLPWTAKVVFGQFVDCIRILGSQRRVYVFIGAALVAAGLIVLAGAAGGWITFAGPETLYVIAMLATMVGVVLQDVVADAMTTEVVDRTDEAGNPRPQNEVNFDLGMVQVLGRLSLSLGIFSVAWLAGHLAEIYTYEQVFLMGLAIPVISVAGVLLVRLEGVERRPIDWRILGGGIAFAVFSVILGVTDVPYAQEIVFVVSMVVVCSLLVLVVGELDAATRRKIMFAAIIIFVYRATPGVGEGHRWFLIDDLGFDPSFFGTLAQTGAGVAMLGMWLFSNQITRHSIPAVMFWLTVVGTVMALPDLGLVYRVDLWTEQMFGFGARTIALLDTAVGSPFMQLSMIPVLTLIAIYAPAGRRATWFALMASLMNLALIAGQLQTKYLNQIFTIERGAYGELDVLLVTVIVMGFVMPVAAIVAFGRKIA